MTTTSTPKISIRRALILSLLAGSMSLAAASPSQAATAKAGTVCKKVNAKSGTGSKAVVCKKTTKGLRWTPVKAAPKKAADTTLPPKKATDTTLPPKKATDTTIAPKKAADTTLPPKK